MASKLLEMKSPSSLAVTGTYLSVTLMNFYLTGPISSKATSNYFSGLFVSTVVLIIAIKVPCFETQWTEDTIIT